MNLTKYIYNSKNYPFLYGVASGIYPMLYYNQKNYALVNSTEHLCFFLITFISVPIIINYLIHLIFKNKRETFIESLTFFTVNTFIFSFLLKTALNPLFQKKITLLLLLCSLVFSYILHKHYKKIVVFKLLLALTTLYPISTIIIKNIKEADFSKDKQPIENIIFKNKPNIYFIQPDGYVNFSVLNEEPYLINNVNFENFLNRESFKTYFNFRSNYTSTLLSNSSIFNIKHHYCKVNDFDLRKYIISDNAVLRILKNNNYKLTYITENPYIVLNRPCKGYDKMNFKYEDIPFLSKGFRNKRDVVLDLNKELESKESKSQFYFIEFFSPSHISSRQQNSKGEQVEKQEWEEGLKESNNILKELISSIKKQDNNPLIIIMADHGGFVGFDYTHEIFEKKIEDKQLINSMYSTILAIHWPNNIYYNSYEKPKSAVNMFRYVFSILGEEPTHMNFKKNNSYVKMDSNNFNGIYQYFDDIGNRTFSKVN